MGNFDTAREALYGGNGTKVEIPLFGDMDQGGDGGVTLNSQDHHGSEDTNPLADFFFFAEDKEGEASVVSQTSLLKDAYHHDELKQNTHLSTSLEGNIELINRDPEEMSSSHFDSPLEEEIGIEGVKKPGGEGLEPILSFQVGIFPTLIKKTFSIFVPFITIFIIVFSFFFLFNNAKLVHLKFSDLFGDARTDVIALAGGIAEKEHHSAMESEKAMALKALEEKYQNLTDLDQEIPILSPDLSAFLEKKSNTAVFDFNTLPPGNRLIIPSLDINVPLVDVPVVDAVDFSEGNFDEELEQGVVKYPTTPSPDKKNGNTLIFGHTSLERWKKNEYGYVFRNIPKLNIGDEFFVIREGNKYHYKMVERKVVLPKHVDEYYREYNTKNESYVTLMGCYPIGSNEKRIMIIAEKIV